MLKSVLAVVKQGLLFLWRSFGKPAIDNPKTPQDESAPFDPAVEAVIDALIELALREAKKRGVPVAPMDVAKEVTRRFPNVALKDAYAKVTAALGRKSGS